MQEDKVTIEIKHMYEFNASKGGTEYTDLE